MGTWMPHTPLSIGCYSGIYQQDKLVNAYEQCYVDYTWGMAGKCEFGGHDDLGDYWIGHIPDTTVKFNFTYVPASGPNDPEPKRPTPTFKYHAGSALDTSARRQEDVSIF